MDGKDNVESAICDAYVDGVKETMIHVKRFFHEKDNKKKVSDYPTLPAKINTEFSHLLHTRYLLKISAKLKFFLCTFLGRT